MRILIFFILANCASAQNTIGLINLNPNDAYDGYNLIYPENQESVYLLDQCGRIINEWTDSLSRPGKTAYLTPNGELLKAKTSGFLYDNTFGTGGAGGVVELRSWDDDLLWRYIAADSLVRQHHDVHMMPNGNVLMILWERHSIEEATERGFDSLSNNQLEIWSDKIIEVNPVTNDIVWEWRSWDHLIQDFDIDKLNFGNVADNHGKIDINYHEFTFGKQDWLHVNSIDYNEELDQIMIGVRNFQEVWIVDHSTTIEEAASDTGGNANKGGDLLFRWGNPLTYNSGTAEDRQLYFQHDVQWARDFVDPSSVYYNKILLFNNFIEQGLSLGQVIDAQWDDVTQSYKMEDGVFLPLTFEYEFSHPDTLKGFSTAASSIQVLPNDNILMCAGRQGRSFELNRSGDVVWEYVTPIINGEPAPQGTTVNISTNFTFQIERYPLDYEGFDGIDLSPGEFLELEPDLTLCNLVPTIELGQLGASEFILVSNPVSTHLLLDCSSELDLTIYDYLGRKMSLINCSAGLNQIAIDGLMDGLYFLCDEKNRSSVPFIVLN